MGNINKIPVYFSLISAMVIIILNIYNGASFKVMSIYVSVGIVLFYIVGMLVRSMVRYALASYIENKITKKRQKKIKEVQEKSSDI
jgi:uncharacterized membrane protein